jgi:S-adenosyl methyltransferase
VTGRGIRQFLDLGCGLPTTPNTHETAQDVQPEALVVYADNDEQVLTHAENILAKTPGVLPIAGDLACPEEILYDWRVRQHLDFYQPMCLILAMTLHFFNAETARTLVSRYVNGLPYGSYLIVSVGQLEGDAGTKFTDNYSAGHLYHHPYEAAASFMDGLDLIDPGVTEARSWRAPAFLPSNGRRGHIWAAVGRKAGSAG